MLIIELAKGAAIVGGFATAILLVIATVLIVRSR
jgi:hypothetical protein